MYNFDEEVNRREVNAIKWDVPENVLPMWVADMDFKTAPEIMEAMAKRLSHGDFGYADVTKEWKQAYISWWEKYHNFKIEEDWIFFSTGVIPTISSTVRKLTTPNENVVILTPVYNVFYNSTLNNGCRVLECPLVYDGSGYEIDFQDLEEKLKNPQTTLMIFCNPHNPVGKIWDKDAIARVGELCKKHNVTVISDEIHCDLCDPGKEYIPFASVSETCKEISITCIAPTKTFNLAGIQTSAAVIPNPILRYKVNRGLNTDECAEPNVFAVEAAVAAFTKCRGWQEELREYLFDNKQRVREFIQKELPEIKVVPSEATYLLWLDISGAAALKPMPLMETYTDCYNRDFSEELGKYLYENAGLFVNSGSHYGKAGEMFLRLNCACTKKTLEEGLKRLKKGVRDWELTT